MNEKFNKNAKVEKLTKKVGRGVRLIVIGPFDRPVVKMVQAATLLILAPAFRNTFNITYRRSKLHTIVTCDTLVPFQEQTSVARRMRASKIFYSRWTM